MFEFTIALFMGLSFILFLIGMYPVNLNRAPVWLQKTYDAIVNPAVTAVLFLVPFMALILFGQ